MAILFNILVLVVGLIMWGFASNPKVQKAGEWMFVCGLLAICFGASPHIPSISVR